jgi:hypothetical protein
MVKWKFWSKSPGGASEAAPQAAVPTVAPHARGFVAPPPRTRALLPDPATVDDPALARKLRRHEAVERQLDEAELAARSENPWTERVRLIDEAIRGIDREMRSAPTRVDREPVTLPAMPITVVEVEPDPPSRVVLAIGDARLEFEEEIDWAERGTSVVRGDMLLANDGLTRLGAQLGIDVHTAERLEAGLFALATAIRDAALDGQPRPLIANLRDVLRPCPECGDIQLWNSVCLNCERHHAGQIRLAGERRRLFEERDSVLAERAEKVDRLPVLRKRCAESAADLGLER